MEDFGILVLIAVIWWFYHLYRRETRPTPQVDPTFLIDLVRATMGADGPPVFEVKARGLFPIPYDMNAAFVTSVLDITEPDDPAPVISGLEAFQEPDNVVFQHRMEAGHLQMGYGFSDWVRVGVVPPDFLQPPFGGARTLMVALRLIDSDSPPVIHHGFAARGPGLLWSDQLQFTWDYTAKGYTEASAHRDEARALAIRMAVAVAMADQKLDRAEGQVLQGWIARLLEPLAPETQERLKALYNKALKDAYEEARTGRLSLSDTSRRLNEIGETYLKYEAMELCHDVMAADGVAAAEEMRLLGRLAEALEVDPEQMNLMRDKRILSLESGDESHEGWEELLGIDPTWEPDRIRKHLRMEFQKWNNRLNTLADESERANAQRMLDMIAEARKKHA